MTKKPKGWRAFDSLLKKIVNVDPQAVNKKIARDKAKRVKKRNAAYRQARGVGLPRFMVASRLGVRV
jgi:rubrerythrin